LEIDETIVDVHLNRSYPMERSLRNRFILF